jgi:hypothetical protein
VTIDRCESMYVWRGYDRASVYAPHTLTLSNPSIGNMISSPCLVSSTRKGEADTARVSGTVLLCATLGRFGDEDGAAVRYVTMYVCRHGWDGMGWSLRYDCWHRLLSCGGEVLPC